MNLGLSRIKVFGNGVESIRGMKPNVVIGEEYVVQVKVRNGKTTYRRVGGHYFVVFLYLYYCG